MGARSALEEERNLELRVLQGLALECLGPETKYGLPPYFSVGNKQLLYIRILGSFDTVAEAVAARNEAARVHGELPQDLDELEVEGRSPIGVSLKNGFWVAKYEICPFGQKRKSPMLAEESEADKKQRLLAQATQYYNEAWARHNQKVWPPEFLRVAGDGKARHRTKASGTCQLPPTISIYENVTRKQKIVTGHRLVIGSSKTGTKDDVLEFRRKQRALHAKDWELGAPGREERAERKRKKRRIGDGVSAEEDMLGMAPVNSKSKWAGPAAATAPAQRWRCEFSMGLQTFQTRREAIDYAWDVAYPAFLRNRAKLVDHLRATRAAANPPGAAGSTEPGEPPPVPELEFLSPRAAGRLQSKVAD